MPSLTYRRPRATAEALERFDGERHLFLAGGTELLNWMRIGIANPSGLVDISRLPGLSFIERREDGGLFLGALVTLAQVARDPSVIADYPVLASACREAASPQIRNRATIAGNLAQATRCEYFRAEEPTPCNKRVAGSGCAARHGLNGRHAIFGWTDECVATQPSDPAAALMALDAVVVTEHADGGRRIPLGAFYALPSDAPSRHNVLRPGELMVRIELPAPAPRSIYLKVRGRASFEFAIVSVALTLEMNDDVIGRTRIALGSVAPLPWRLHRAEQRLIGSRVASPELDRIIDEALAESKPLAHNRYKVTMAGNLVRRAFAEAAALPCS